MTRDLLALAVAVVAMFAFGRWAALRWLRPEDEGEPDDEMRLLPETAVAQAQPAPGDPVGSPDPRPLPAELAGSQDSWTATAEQNDDGDPLTEAWPEDDNATVAWLHDLHGDETNERFYLELEPRRVYPMTVEEFEMEQAEFMNIMRGNGYPDTLWPGELAVDDWLRTNPWRAIWLPE